MRKKPNPGQFPSGGPVPAGCHLGPLPRGQAPSGFPQAHNSYSQLLFSLTRGRGKPWPGHFRMALVSNTPLGSYHPPWMLGLEHLIPARLGRGEAVRRASFNLIWCLLSPSRIANGHRLPQRPDSEGGDLSAEGREGKKERKSRAALACP